MRETMVNVPIEKMKTHGPGRCRECGENITARLKYCNEQCREKFYRKKYTTWVNFRWRILNRDKFKCRDCGQKFDDEELDVHHLRQISNGGKMFKKKNVITLCRSCHKERHRNRPKVFKIDKAQKALSEF